MSNAQKNEGLIYRCPICLMTLNDVIIDLYDDGLYHCVKCGYTANSEQIHTDYAAFRSRYALRKQRLTLEDQFNL